MKEDIVKLFNKALKKAKSYGINFIAVSGFCDSTLELIELQRVEQDIILGVCIDFSVVDLEDWQLDELRTGCKEWIKYEGD